MKRITSKDLQQWAPSRDCQENLPLLVRRLIRESVPNIIKLHMPAGDDINTPGLDGILIIEEATEFVSKGVSAWEIGCDVNVKGKADREFAKRTAVPDVNIKKSTFVFVTPYKWANKTKWEKEKKKISQWRDVKVIDGMILEEWIEQCSVTQSWLADLLNITISNSRSLEDFWKEWRVGPQYTLFPELIIGSRTEERKVLDNFLLDSPRLQIIKGFTHDESLAFIASCIELLDFDKREELYAKTLIVETELEMRRIINSKNALLIILRSEIKSVIDQAIRNGHHVILLHGFDEYPTYGASIELSRLRKNELERALLSMGLNETQIGNLIRDSGQSLSILRRRLGFEKTNRTEWISTSEPIHLIPALFANSWSESNKQDRELISRLAGVPYEDAIQKISKFKIVKDPPLIQIDGVWKINSAIDLWMNIAPHVNSIEFNKLSACFDSIVSDKNKEVSFLCKRGLFQTLAIVSYLANKLTFALSSNPQEFVDKIVYKVLSTGNWLKIHDVLPSLAEASPIVFMNALKTSLAENQDSVFELFDRKHGTAFAHLLWALESLMTSSDYLLQATILLGKLNVLVPDTGMVNSPMHSLKNSFTPWYNQTFGTTKSKIAALNALAQSDPGVAFNLFLQLLKTSSASPLHKFNWRLDYGALKVEQTFEAVRELGLFLIRKLIWLSKNTDSRVAALIDIYNITGKEDRQKILSTIKARLVKTKSNLIWNVLREYFERQKNWKQISQKEIEELEEVLTLYEPQDLILKNQYLFESTPWLIRGNSKKEDTWKRNALIVHKKRISAVKEIYRDGGIMGLTKLINVCTAYNLRLIANACRLRKPDEIKVFSWLNNMTTDDKKRIFAQHYIVNQSVTLDDWAFRTIKRLKASIKDLRPLIQFILCLPQRRKFWDLIENEPEKVQYEYWNSIFPNFYSLQDEDIQYVVKKMQSAQRHIVLLNCYVSEVENISTPKLFELFNNAIQNDHVKKDTINWNEVHSAFENLQLRNDVHEDDMVQLELKYLDFLTGWHVKVRPIFTYKKMLQSPVFFVALIKEINDIYQIENYDAYKQDDLAKLFRKASSYNSLIDHWNNIPGIKENGNIDGNILNRWVNSALKLTLGNDKLKYRVECKIGEIFGRCSRHISDWPQKQICAILDRTQSDAMLSNFRTAIFNSRGLSVRMPYDGGEQERALSKFFKDASDKIIDKYPFTASALLYLSKSYERDANREDDKAQLDELLR